MDPRYSWTPLSQIGDAPTTDTDVAAEAGPFATLIPAAEALVFGCVDWFLYAPEHPAGAHPGDGRETPALS